MTNTSRVYFKLKLNLIAYILACCEAIRTVEVPMVGKSRLSLTVLQFTLYNASGNRANHNAENLLYTRRYYIQPTHHAPTVCRISRVKDYVLMDSVGGRVRSVRAS